MKRIIVHFLFVLSVCATESSTAGASTLVDMLNLLHKSFIGLDDNEAGVQEQATEREPQQRVDCRELKGVKRIEPRQTAQATWVRTPEGLKLHIRTGDKEIHENFSFNNDGSEIVEAQEIDLIDGKNNENCDDKNCENQRVGKPFQANAGILVNDEIGIPSQRRRMGGKRPERCKGEGSEGFKFETDGGRENSAPVCPGFERRGDVWSERRDLRNDKNYAKRGERHSGERFDGRRAEKFRNNFEKKPYHHSKDIGEAIFVEMRRQTKILKHIEEMLEHRENFFKNRGKDRAENREKVFRRRNN